MKLPVKTRTLDKIQNTIGKLKCVSKVLEIISIVFSAGLVLFAILGSVFLGDTSKYDGILYIMIGEKSIAWYVPVIYAVSIAFFTVACHHLRRYLNTEIEEGSPFTQRGADKLMKTAIVWCVLGIVCTINDIVTSYLSLLASIPSYMPESEALRQEVLNAFLVNMSNISPIGGFLVISGVAMVIISLVLKYGAETVEALKEKTGDKSFVKSKSNNDVQSNVFYDDTACD